nr:sterile alpha motif domain-containing protein 13 isoform X1 [Taeniopygia guttata]
MFNLFVLVPYLIGCLYIPIKHCLCLDSVYFTDLLLCCGILELLSSLFLLKRRSPGHRSPVRSAFPLALCGAVSGAELLRWPWYTGNAFGPKSHVGNEIIVNVHVGGCNNHWLISSRVSGAWQRRVCATLSFTLGNLHRQWIGFFIKQEDLEILGSISWIDILEMSSKRSHPCAIPSLCCSVWSALSSGGKSLAHWQGQSPLEEWAD